MLKVMEQPTQEEQVVAPDTQQEKPAEKTEMSREEIQQLQRDAIEDIVEVAVGNANKGDISTEENINAAIATVLEYDTYKNHGPEAGLNKENLLEMVKKMYEVQMAREQTERMKKQDELTAQEEELYLTKADLELASLRQEVNNLEMSIKNKTTPGSLDYAGKKLGAKANKADSAGSGKGFFKSLFGSKKEAPTGNTAPAQAEAEAADPATEMSDAIKALAQKIEDFKTSNFPETMNKTTYHIDTVDGIGINFALALNRDTRYNTAEIQKKMTEKKTDVRKGFQTLAQRFAESREGLERKISSLPR